VNLLAAAKNRKVSSHMLGKIHPSHFYAFGTVFFWAFSYVGTREALTSFSSTDIGFFRNFTAAFLFVIVLHIKGVGLPPLKDYPVFFPFPAPWALPSITSFSIWGWKH
jgi:drug/metabolite transporter (DMT)-like permease